MEYRDLALSSDNLFSNRGLFEIWQKEHNAIGTYLYYQSSIYSMFYGLGHELSSRLASLQM